MLVLLVLGFDGLGLSVVDFGVELSNLVAKVFDLVLDGSIVRLEGFDFAVGSVHL